MRALSPRHRQMLEGESGIAPEVIAARGYYTETRPAALAALGFAPYQCRPGLVIPQWTTAGVQVGYVLRPDNPRRDPKTGKAVKYESIAGSRPRLDVPPSVAAALPDPTIPLDFTEGSKKADAAGSHSRVCISLNGVYGFLTGKLVIPDFDDVALKGRLVRIFFDSDVTRKPGVRDALERFVAALERRGAIVRVGYLPEGPNGEKTGLDDFYVAGGTNEELDALARPWQPDAIPFAPDPDDPAEEFARVRRERDELKRSVSMLVQTCLNPHLRATEKVAIVAAFGLTQQKRNQGDVAPDGTVTLSSAEVSNDYRPKPEPGGHVAAFNRDGSKPRMSRDQVTPIMRAASARNILPAHSRKVTRHRDGASFVDTEWSLVPPASLDAFLKPAAEWCPPEPKVRKVRDQTCPHCQEVHAIVRKDICQGCGSIMRETVIDPPNTDIEPTAPLQTPHRRKFSSGQETSVKGSLSPAPLPIGRKFSSGEPAAVPLEPAWLSDPAPLDPWTDIAFGRSSP